MLCDPLEVAAASFQNICRQRSMSDVRSQLPAIARFAMVAPLRALLQAAVLAGVLLTLVGCDAVQESFSLDRGTASEVVSTSTLPVFDPANPVSALFWDVQDNSQINGENTKMKA